MPNNKNKLSKREISLISKYKKEGKELPEMLKKRIIYTKHHEI